MPYCHKMSKKKKFSFVLLTLWLRVCGIVGVEETVSVSVMEGRPVTLHTGVIKPQHEPMRWYFNDTLIAQINDPSTSCLYDGEDRRFRDRVEVDYETGSLTITNIRSEHAGRYEAELIRSESSGKKQSLNRNRKCDSTKITRKISRMGVSIGIFNVTVSAAGLRKADSQTDKNEPETDKTSGLSPGAVAGIVVAVLLVCVAVAGVYVVYKHHRRTRRDGERRNRELL